MAKRFKAAQEAVDRQTKYDIDQALDLVLKGATAKFDETIDVSVNLGVDAKQSDQQVRGAVALPNGLGKAVRVLVFAKGAKEQEAKDAGADYVGAEDLVEKINSGWLDFDKAIATPDMMATVARVAKVLGPRGLMPNPKVGTVTMDVAKAIAAEKKGKCDYRVDKASIIHAPIGKKSMGASALKENFNALMSAVIKAKPATSKGNYLLGMSISSTMGPGVKLDVNKVQGSLS